MYVTFLRRTIADTHLKRRRHDANLRMRADLFEYLTLVSIGKQYHICALNKMLLKSTEVEGILLVTDSYRQYQIDNLTTYTWQQYVLQLDNLLILNLVLKNNYKNLKKKKGNIIS